ncbi:HD-GYP domain-containing protein [Mesobacillus maritimus]|uniref:HD-GYP domain-containing protein n=1 Tax=Mesobacillus maritimus TaxID=1643336 RepID=UPI00384BB252
MKLKKNQLLNNPAFFRYSFVVLLIINTTLLFYDVGENHIYILYILATVCLGIGFFNRPIWLLMTLTTLLVFIRFMQGPESTTLLKLMILESSYLIIMFISVGFMKKHQKIKEDQLELISALSKALDSRDSYTSGHSQNVSIYATNIAVKMKLSNDLIEAIRIGGLLHDIGKIGVPESILLKPGKLSNEEFRIIKNHPLIGYEMIKHVKEFHDKGILDMVMYHHERYDGKGYPNGLKGEQIPFAARIMAVADSFDAMTSKRVYSQKMSIKDALLEIKNNKGTQFDPEIAEVFLSLFETNELDLNIRDTTAQVNSKKDEDMPLLENLG